MQDPQTNTGAAFIGLNNPHAKTAPKELCKNRLEIFLHHQAHIMMLRCGDMAWVDWDMQDIESGYMYCCTVEDAREAIPEIPQLQADNGLLKVK